MDYEQKQREAFYLIKKYSSYTWYAEIYRLWKLFCENYERDFYRKPPPIYTPGAWDELNLKMFWAYAGEMEEGLAALLKGDKARGYELLDNGTRFNEWLFSRRFEEMDLSDFGYRRTKTDGVSDGIFADAERAYDMTMAGCNFRHTDDLRRDFAGLPDNWRTSYAVPNGKKLKIPFGVMLDKLPALPLINSSAPTVMSGDEVPALGIWIVEPDAAHRGQTYCMAYLRPWAAAVMRVSEQEYEVNTRWERTDDETYRKDSDKIKDYPVRWRLLWRDTRYADRKIPPEEAEYLIYREPGAAAPPPAPAAQLRCEAGQPCPRAGWWTTPAAGGERRRFAQGDVMPALQSDWGATIWQFESGTQGD